eukprot:7054753-Prymnesium_polylepis.1
MRRDGHRTVTARSVGGLGRLGRLALCPGAEQRRRAASHERLLQQAEGRDAHTLHKQEKAAQGARVAAAQPLGDDGPVRGRRVARRRVRRGRASELDEKDAAAR